jgi:hypothetical protein
MALANDAVLVTPGSGATIATHSPGGSSTTEYQVTIIANSTGNIIDSMPTYGLNVPQLLNAANKYHWELFNHPSSGKTLTIRGLWPIAEQSQTIGGSTPARYEFFRTTAVSSGGTASAVFESSSTILANFFRLNPGDTSLSSHISCRTQVTSITTGTFLFPMYANSFATNLFNSNGGFISMNVLLLQQSINMIPQREFGQELVVPAGQGVACRQGTVASAGSMGWLIEFTVDP